MDMQEAISRQSCETEENAQIEALWNLSLRGPAQDTLARQGGRIRLRLRSTAATRNEKEMKRAQ